MKFGFAFLFPLLLLISSANGSEATARAQIGAFNQKFDAAILRMDNAAVLSLWSDDGVQILPRMPVLVGKPAISGFLEETEKHIAGFHVKSNETKFQSIDISGDTAVEWGTTDQVVADPTGKEMTSHGYILLVLRREKGEWKLLREMWGPR